MMHPFEKESAGPPKGISTHLDVRLKPGWRLDRRRHALISECGQRVSLRGLLPSGTKIVPVAPSLAAADPKSLSKDEDLLARSLQAVIASGSEPTDLVEALRDLNGVESVSTPPRIALP